MAKYSIDGPPHDDDQDQDNTDTQSKSEPCTDRAPNDEITEDPLAPDNVDIASAKENTDATTEDNFSDVDLSDVNEVFSDDHSNVESDDPVPDDENDFSDISLPDNEELTQGNKNASESESASNSSDPVSDVQSDPDDNPSSPDSNSDGEETFSEDASETWGDTNETEEFDQAVTFKETDATESNPKDNTTQNLSPNNGEVNTDDDHQTNTDESDPLGFDDVEIDDVEEPDDTIVDPLEPLESPSDTDTSFNTPGSETNSAAEPQPTSTEETNPNIEPSGTTPDGEVEPPTTTPKPRVRRPTEILSNTVKTCWAAIVFTYKLVTTIIGVGLYGISILMEMGAALLLGCYFIILAMALLDPSATAAAPTDGTSGRLYLIWHLSIRVVPFVIGTFFVSILIDELVNDGDRYETDMSFSRL